MILLHRNIKDFDNFTKIASSVGDLGKIIVATGFEKVAQSPINCPIWSHWKVDWLVCRSANEKVSDVAETEFCD